MKATTLLSSYITSDTIREEGPRTYTIEDAEIVEFKDKHTDTVQRKLALIVDDDQKLLLNKENTRTLIEGFGTQETDEWVNRSFEAYFEPNVSFGGKRVGGIRLRVN